MNDPDMKPNSNFTIIYPTCGSVYLRWTLCSIASVLERGNYCGEILVITKDEIEASIVRNLYPDIRTLVLDIEKPGSWPGYMYKAVLLHQTRDIAITTKDNVMLLDSDILVYGDLNPLLNAVDRDLWIDRIYQQSKSKAYKPYVVQMCEQHGIDYDRDYYEYNSGCWNIPTAHYAEIMARYGELFYSSYKVDDRGKRIDWTDQPFFTLSCMLSGLKPKILKDRVEVKNRMNLVVAHGEEVGIKHFHGKHRRNKEEWQRAIEDEGFLEDLRVRSQTALNDAEHRYLWQDDYSSKTFFPCDALHHRIWRKVKRFLYRSE